MRVVLDVVFDFEVHCLYLNYPIERNCHWLGTPVEKVLVGRPSPLREYQPSDPY